MTFTLGLLVGWVLGFALGSLGMIHYITDDKSVGIYEEIRQMRIEDE